MNKQLSLSKQREREAVKLGNVDAGPRVNGKKKPRPAKMGALAEHVISKGGAVRRMR